MAVPQHAHEGDHSAPAGDQQQWRRPFRSRPDEVASYRPAQLNRVAALQLAGEERRHLPVVKAIDRELECWRLWRRGDRVAAFRAVAVFGRQADVGVLACEVTGPVADREPNGFYSTRFLTDGDDRRGLPGR